MLNVGDNAPNFSGPDQKGKEVSLKGYEGKYVIVWWIPSTMAGMTPACCDTIAKGFGGILDEHPQLNIVGLSFDSREEMDLFAKRGHISFPLLADPDKEIGTSYDVRRYDEWDCFPRKVAYLVGPDQTIVKVYRTIDPDFFVDEVVHDLDALGAIKDDKPSLFRRLIGR